MSTPVVDEEDEQDEQEGIIPENRERDEVLNRLDDALEEAHRKATSGRVYDAENEKVRQGWLRTVGYLAGQYRQLLKDRQLDEMNERLERIEANQEE